MAKALPTLARISVWWRLADRCAFCYHCLCNMQPDRAVLGDIVLWFAASAVAEPTAALVMWQATKQDKGWLSG